jgi:hypothetical protein
MLTAWFTPSQAQRRVMPTHFGPASPPGDALLRPAPRPDIDPVWMQRRGDSVRQRAGWQDLKLVVSLDVGRIETGSAFAVSEKSQDANDSWDRWKLSSSNELAAHCDRHETIETLQHYRWKPRTFLLQRTSVAEQQRQQQRNQGAIQLVDSWLLEDSDVVDETWDSLRTELDSERSEGSRLFP